MRVYTGWPPPKKKRRRRNSRFSGLCSDQQLSFFTLLDRASFPHYNHIKIIKFGWELFILWVISCGLSFSGFARFPEFWGTIKGEVRSWSNLISEERVKFSEQNSENLMKIGWKIRKLWILKFHKFSGNISWPVRMNMQMSELMMSSPHNFPFILYTEMTKISYFSYDNVRLALITLWIDA